MKLKQKYMRQKPKKKNKDYDFSPLLDGKYVIILLPVIKTYYYNKKGHKSWREYIQVRQSAIGFCKRRGLPTPKSKLTGNTLTIKL